MNIQSSKCSTTSFYMASCIQHVNTNADTNTVFNPVPPPQSDVVDKNVACFELPNYSCVCTTNFLWQVFLWQVCRHSGRHNNSKRSKYFFVDQYKRPKILPTFFMTKCTCYGSFWTEGEVDYTDERIKFVINLLVYRLYPALSFLPKN